MLDNLLIASNNPAKIKRYRGLFKNSAKKILTLKDLKITEKPEEAGQTAEENAILKVNFYREKSNLPTFSEDESLLVDFLPENEQPGVHIRRINKKVEATDKEVLDYWSNKLSTVPEQSRTGRWHFALGLGIPGGEIKLVSLDWPTKFYFPPSKIIIPGWPMSSLQGSLKFDKPHSERTPEENAEANKERDKIILRSFGQLFN